MSPTNAALALEDGRVFRGASFAAEGVSVGEIVFNTSMTGYQEISTDPSYHGQIVAMTYPQIGNYGVNPDDVESDGPKVAGFAVREHCRAPSNWRSKGTFGDWLKAHGIVAVEGIDTRALTRHIRTGGAKRSALATGDWSDADLVAKAHEWPGLIGRDLVREVTCPAAYEWPPPSPQPSPRGRGREGEGAPSGEGNKGERVPAHLLEFARKLRQESTDAEKLVWSLLRNRDLGGGKFRRQHPFDKYVLDFYCHEAKLVIELDGGQHADNAKQAKDEERTRVLNAAGLRVLRFWNNEVLQQTEAVLSAIWEALPLPHPSPPGRGSQGEGRPSPPGRGAGGEGSHVVAYDFGAKRSILKCLAAAGCRVTVVPASATAEEVLALKPDGVFLSNGPGDPEGVPYAIEATRKLVQQLPVFGICLGHQILGLAFGGKTYKLKFGHRGANQPVKDLTTGRVEITAQNHGFCVDLKTLDPDAIETTHVNLNDGTSEGLRHKRLPVFSVQYHPEASPGPHDARHLFRRFADLMAERKAATGSPSA